MLGTTGPSLAKGCSCIIDIVCSLVYINVISAYNDKVVAFLRQSNIQDILKEKYPTYASSSQLKEKVHKICVGGTEALDKVSNDLQLTIMLRYVYLPY